jgi:hypothetical protein
MDNYCKGAELIINYLQLLLGNLLYNNHYAHQPHSRPRQILGMCILQLTWSPKRGHMTKSDPLGVA